MTGTILLNRYRLDAELGRGGMGVVYRAQDLLLDRAVAVKLLSKQDLTSEGQERLLREAQAAARLNHPNIVTIHDVGDAEGVPFVVMELVNGKPLNEVRLGEMSEKTAVAKQICAALEHAHANGVIHRDLKPENIFLLEPDRGSGPRVKLMDFGLAQTSAMRHLTEKTAIVGTIFYIAPELIQGQPASPQSDLYALGVMLYELFAGRPPFEGDNLMAIVSQHLFAPVIPPSTYNPAIQPPLDRLIVQLLSKHPEDRPESAAALLWVFEQVSAETQAAEVPASTAVDPTSLLERIARGRFVARQNEMAEALHRWQQALRGEGHVLLVSGEPGVGKTRFARELMARARMSGATVLAGDCFAEGSAPYAAIGDMVSNVDLSGMPSTILADLLAIVPFLRMTYPDVPPNPILEPQAERQRIMENVVNFFAKLCERGPVLLFIDDVHWADSGSLFLLHQLARRAPALPILVLLAYREVELSEAQPLYDLLLDLNRERLATRIKLLRFDRQQTGALLSTLFQKEISTEFVDGIYSETEGNPFFIEEVCKALIESGKLYHAGGRWQRTGMDQIEIPQNVRVAIELRVARLPQTAQDILRAAAILGREFAFDVLCAMTEGSEEAVIEALETAERAQLISEDRHAGQLSFTFVHALIPMALREGLSAIRRHRLHRRAAQAIEHVHASALASGDFAAALGRHYAEAGSAAKAAEHYLQAAERARGVFAYPEAIAYYRQALAMLKELGAAELSRAARTAMTLAQLYHTVYNFEQSQLAYQEAFALWQQDEKEQGKTAGLPAPQALRLLWNPVRCLDLTKTYYWNNLVLVQQLFRGLVHATQDLDIVPDLAQDWDIEENGRRYIFHLRRDVHWSDGHPVTAQDFEFAWKYQLDPAQDAPNKNIFFDIQNAKAYYEGRASADAVGVRAADDRTLVVDLEKPVGHFLLMLSGAMAFAIPRHAVEALGAAWAEPGKMITNGPFCLETWQPDESVVLVRNPDYRGRWSGNVARVELTCSARWTEETRLQAYQENRCDTIVASALYTPAEREQYRQTGEYVQQPIASVGFISFNTQRPPFDDARVRQALALAINCEQMWQDVFHGSGSPATGGFTPPCLPGHSAGGALPFDPDQARRLLAQAGYPGGSGFPEVEARNWIRARPQINPYLQQIWRDVLGINIPVTFAPSEDRVDQRLRTTANMGVNGWVADYPDPHTYLNVATHLYTPNWQNAEYEHLLDVAEHTTDTLERFRIYQAAERILIQEAVIVPLVYFNWDRLKKPWLKHYPVSPLQFFYWKDVIIEPH